MVGGPNPLAHKPALARSVHTLPSCFAAPAAPVHSSWDRGCHPHLDRLSHTVSARSAGRAHALGQSCGGSDQSPLFDDTGLSCLALSSAKPAGAVRAGSAARDDAGSSSLGVVAPTKRAHYAEPPRVRANSGNPRDVPCAGSVMARADFGSPRDVPRPVERVCAVERTGVIEHCSERDAAADVHVDDDSAVRADNFCF